MDWMRRVGSRGVRWGPPGPENSVVSYLCPLTPVLPPALGSWAPSSPLTRDGRCHEDRTPLGVCSLGAHGRVAEMVLPAALCGTGKLSRHVPEDLSSEDQIPSALTGL